MKCQQKKNTLQIWHCSSLINKLAALHTVLTRYIPHILNVFNYIFMEYKSHQINYSQQAKHLSAGVDQFQQVLSFWQLLEPWY